MFRASILVGGWSVINGVHPVYFYLFGVFIFVSVLLSTSVERVGVSPMRDFFMKLVGRGSVINGAYPVIFLVIANS